MDKKRKAAEAAPSTDANIHNPKEKRPKPPRVPMQIYTILMTWQKSWIIFGAR